MNPFAPIVDFASLGVRDLRAGAIPLLDFTQGPLAEEEVAGHRLAIGRYDEHRPGAYAKALFTEGPDGPRDIHMGIDIFAPVGTPVHAFADGRVHLVGYNAEAGDYGGTVLTSHVLEGLEIYALYGHLSRASLDGKRPGQPVDAGETLGWIGDRAENGGWVPHVHFQLSYGRPAVPDLPGVVNRAQYALARLKYPDPRLVLGAIY